MVRLFVTFWINPAGEKPMPSWQVIDVDEIPETGEEIQKIEDFILENCTKIKKITHYVEYLFQDSK